MKLHEYISDLLNNYNRVIIPDFGGFICRENTASIDLSKNIFTPPSKQIKFDAHLNINDNLLLNYILTVNKISYDEALQFIKTGISSWKKELREKGKISLNKIGIFKLNSKNEVEFETTKFTDLFKSSFGMESFHLEPIKRIKQNTTSHISTFSLNSSLIEKKEQVNLLTSQALNIENKSISYMKYASIIITIMVTSVFYLMAKNETTSIKDITIKQTENLAYTKNINNGVSKIYYTIVVGSFKDKSNAIKLRGELNKKGYYIKIVPYKKFFRVCHDQYYSSVEAKTALTMIKSEIKNAWIGKVPLQDSY